MLHDPKQMIENYIQAYNNFDVPGMIKDLAPNLVFENLSNGETNVATQGLEEFKQQAESAKTYFSERKQVITAWDFQDNQVSIDIQYFGVAAIDIPDFMKAGDTINLQGKSIFTFQDGKIIKIQDIS